MNKAAKWTIITGALLVLIGGLALSVRAYQTDNDEKPATSNKSHDKKSEGVKLDRETQIRIGIEVQTLKQVIGRREITVYGALEADPSESFALRAPLAGVLKSNGNWPEIGSSLAAGKRVGEILPRLLPLERLTLAEHLASIRADLTAAKASAVATGEEAKRLRLLNADNKNVSDKALQEAEANAAAAEARVRSAETSQQLITSSLQPHSSLGAVPLEISKGGQVLEVAAQPDEAVEAGQMLLRVSRFNRLLARLYVPPGQEVDASVSRAIVTPTGFETNGIPAERVALAGTLDPRFQGQTVLFRLLPSRIPLRPGQAVSARLPAPGSSEAGVLIPARAVIRFQGQTWVYLQDGPGVFVRRMIALDRPSSGGWMVTSGVKAGQQVVVSGAQILLSEEMKSQLESDEQ